MFDYFSFTLCHKQKLKILPFLPSSLRCSFFFFFKTHFFHSFERQVTDRNERDRDLAFTGSLLRQLQYPGLGQAKAQSQNSIRCPTCVSVAHVLGPSSAVFSGNLTGSQLKSRAAMLGKQWLNPLCYNASPS